jgi:hypothetical protein
MSAYISQLAIYPLKSAAAIAYNKRTYPLVCSGIDVGYWWMRKVNLLPNVNMHKWL